MLRGLRLVRLVCSLVLFSPIAAFAQNDLIVEKKTFTMPSYTTVAGATIKDVKIGWESAGTLNADKSNAILIAHFFSGTSHAFGKYSKDDKAAGAAFTRSADPAAGTRRGGSPRNRHTSARQAAASVSTSS